jgi:hypothetical protein
VTLWKLEFYFEVFLGLIAINSDDARKAMLIRNLKLGLIRS